MGVTFGSKGRFKMKAVLLVAAILICTNATATSVKKTEGGRNRQDSAVYPPCALQDVNFALGDYPEERTQSIAKSVKECSKICHADAKCKGWSIYVPKIGGDPSAYEPWDCVMKTGDVMARQVSHIGTVSGVVGCGIEE